jgi:hypothetical protein
MKLQVASSVMATDDGTVIGGEKCFCNGEPGSPCKSRRKVKKFNLNGFLSMSDEDGMSQSVERE